ncbi:MAG TPA: ATP-dependent protease ATPase subunit HslU [Gemmatimonadales bacterium]|nr:ATP-dependent protease ATPase subunit HslU [Gemmatimonadales bacterium]
MSSPPPVSTTPPEPLPWLEELPPRQIVAELDRYVVGQEAAKRAIAIAIRNRWRRAQAPDDIRDEITPSNIILIGPTGVGKTEIARRLARLAGAPFVKVEASRFTEVGYVGRDVESMVRELVDAAIGLVRAEREDEVYGQAEQRAEERLLDLLLPAPPEPPPVAGESGRVFVAAPGGGVTEDVPEDQRRQRSRDKLRQLLADGKLEDREVELEVVPQSFPVLEGMQPPPGMEGPDVNWLEMFQEMLPKRKKRRSVKVAEARRILIDEELKRLVDQDDVVNEALDRVENHGMIFVDEIDKVAGERSQTGPDISREGVQRDLLPIVEGATVQTRYGYVRTDHILFIAAGAFHVSKPTDLIPELQGRFPIRVELLALEEDDLVRILTEPESALVGQYQALLGTEGVSLEFTADAVRQMARLAARVNDQTENIGARRLATILETVLDEVSFEAGGTSPFSVTIDGEYVRRRLDPVVQNQDLSRFIL